MNKWEMEKGSTLEPTLEGKSEKETRKVILVPMTFTLSNDINISLSLTVTSNRLITSYMCLLKFKLILIR